DLVVLHGLGADAPDWALEAAATAGRVLVFPADDAAELGVPVAVGPETPGDFYPSEVPASPVAAFLGDIETAGLTPLAGLRTAEAPAGAWAPLLVTRGRQGAGMPLALGGGD